MQSRVALLLVAVGAALVAGARWLQAFNFGAAELKFIGDFGLGAIGLLGTLLAALATAQVFFEDIRGGALACVLTRSTRRGEYIAGQLAGMTALLALFTVALGGLLAALVVWRGAQWGASSLSLPALLLACGLQWLKLSLVSAMTLLVCSYAGNALFASCAGILLAAVAQARGLAGGGWAWPLRLWPNLGLFDAESVLSAGHLPGGGWLLGLVGYWAVYLLLFGGVAAYVFRRREF